MKGVRCAIVGCGMIAHEYAATLAAARQIELVACADEDLARAEAFAAQHRLESRPSLPALLAADDITILVILTPPDSHDDLARQAIRAEASVYVEKPLCLTSEAAANLLAEADAHGVRVGAAPDTFLGPAVQAAGQTIARGLIGEPLSAAAALLSRGPERWHPHPQPFYAAGLGPLLDMGPYYLSVLTHLLGPISHVAGATTTSRSHRIIETGPRAGEFFAAQAATHVDALLRTSTGLPVTFTASFDIIATARPHLEIYGSGGTLQLPDPNFHDGVVRLRRRGDDAWQAVATPSSATPGRGLGVIELADALLGERPHLATGERACQVLAVTEAIRAAALTDHRVAL